MKHHLLLTLFTVLLLGAAAQGPVQVSQRTLHPCDTLQFDWDGSGIGKNYKLASLHLWIDDMEGGMRWKYRYPVVNGRASGSLELPATMKPGTYAFNFMGSEVYLEMKGYVRKLRVKTARNHETRKMDTILVQEEPGWVGQDIRYNLVSRAGVLFDSVLQVAPDGAFRLPPLVFGDTANLTFKPEKTSNQYYIFLETPLDSAFTPFHTQTVFVTVEAQAAAGTTPSEDTTRYGFVLNDTLRNVVTLEEVVVTGKSKAKKYEDQFVSGLFRNSLDGKTFNAWEDEITESNNILLFLQANVPGLQIRADAITTTVNWRGTPVTFFLNEVLTDAMAIRSIPASEIALIKTYPAPASMLSFIFGGAIAIYTKRGEYAPEKGPRYSFPVLGYTQGETTLQ